MNCTRAQSWLSRQIDGELSDSERKELDAHLAECASCSRDYGLLTLPRRIAQAVPAPAPSPYFYQRLRKHIEGESQKTAGWQVFWNLARPMVPTLAGVTLALLSVFAYFQIHGPEAELFEAFDRAFVSEGQAHRMLVAEQSDITYESVLNAIVEQESNGRRNQNLK